MYKVALQKSRHLTQRLGEHDGYQCKACPRCLYCTDPDAARSPSFAMSKDQCEALFIKADSDGDGALAQMEDPKWEQRILHMTDIKKKDQTIITKEQFMTSCERGEMDGM